MGHCFGPRPPADLLKAWMVVNWENRGIKLPQVQYLPNGHFVFMFEAFEDAMYVLSQGT